MTIAIHEPIVHVHRTKTAGWQVIYVSTSGRNTIRERRLEFRDAIMAGATLSRIHTCRLEVDR